HDLGRRECIIDLAGLALSSNRHALLTDNRPKVCRDSELAVVNGAPAVGPSVPSTGVNVIVPSNTGSPSKLILPSTAARCGPSAPPQPPPAASKRDATRNCQRIVRAILQFSLRVFSPMLRPRSAARNRLHLFAGPLC